MKLKRNTKNCSSCGYLIEKKIHLFIFVCFLLLVPIGEILGKFSTFFFFHYWLAQCIKLWSFFLSIFLGVKLTEQGASIPVTVTFTWNSSSYKSSYDAYQYTKYSLCKGYLFIISSKQKSVIFLFRIKILNIVIICEFDEARGRWVITYKKSESSSS